MTIIQHNCLSGCLDCLAQQANLTAIEGTWFTWGLLKASPCHEELRNSEGDSLYLPSSNSLYWSAKFCSIISCRKAQKFLEPFLDLCVSSLRRGHANLLCIVPILSDFVRRHRLLNFRSIYTLENGPIEYYGQNLKLQKNDIQRFPAMNRHRLAIPWSFLFCILRLGGTHISTGQYTCDKQFPLTIQPQRPCIGKFGRPQSS